MFLKYMLIILLAVVSGKGDFLIKKLCKDVDWKMCDIHHLAMVSCSGDARFCSVKRGKPYIATVDLTPHFSAQNLLMAIYGDDDNTDTFNKTIMAPQSACDILTCPVEGETRRIFDYYFVLDKTLGIGKFPVKVKFWNADDSSQVCCFTFKVNVLK